MAVYSMTGYATASGDAFVLTIKGVNHRFLDVQVRVPSGHEVMESLLLAAVRGQVRRGHVELTLQMTGGDSGTVRVSRNDALLGELVRVHREAAAVHGFGGEPDLHALLRSPGVLVSTMERAGVEAPEVNATVELLLERFQAARALEGAALAIEMHAAMGRLLALTEEKAALRLGVRDAHVERLRVRLFELLEGMEVSEERLLTEAAMLAQRSDVEEEMVRMRTHARQFQARLDAGGEMGKQLDFLLQEMNREANTMVSKVNGGMGERGLRLTEIGLAMKTEIERVKEQVQNVE